MSTVNGAARSAGPRPAAQPRTSVSRATASSWRTLDHLNARSHVPIVDGARVSSNNSGAAPELFDDTRAPSTIGTWLRAFKWSNVRQLDAVARETLVRGWQAGLGPADLAAPLTVDIDSSVCQTYGVKKQGAKFGYTKVRGYHPVLATCAATGEVLHARMRGGNAASARDRVSAVKVLAPRERPAS